MTGIVESHYLPTQNVIHKIISLPKLSYKTNTPSGMSIVTKTMNQIGPCVYTRYNENMYKKHVGLGDELHFSFSDYNIVIFFNVHTFYAFSKLVT